MSNQLVTVKQEVRNALAALSPELTQGLQTALGDAMYSFGSSLKVLRLKGSRFALHDGANEVIVPAEKFFIIPLAIAPADFYSGYMTAYKGSDEGKAPDWLWHPDDVPADLPERFIGKDAEGNNKFRTNRRMAFLRVHQTEAGGFRPDVENIYIHDFGGMSIFGDNTVTGAMSLGNYMRFCVSNQIIPLQVIVQVVFDTRHAVPVIRLNPQRHEDGTLRAIENVAALTKLAQIATSPEVAQMMKVEAKRPSEDGEAPAPAAKPAVKPAAKPATKPAAKPAPAPVVEEPVVEDVVVEEPAAEVVESADDLLAQANAFEMPESSPAPATAASSSDEALMALMADM